MAHSPIVYYVYEELKKHVGREQAISAAELCAVFGICERHLRQIVHTIRNSGDLEKVIGSCNAGYFVCTKEEQTRANRRIYRQAFSLLKTARANDRKAERNGQGKIKLGEYFKDFYESLGETDGEPDEGAKQ